MDRPGDTQQFAELLRELKQRSQLSYAELARRTFTSSSTLHRYCAGAAVPSDYDTLARIALQCGAGDDELHELVRCWLAACDRRTATAPPTDVPAEPPPADEPVGASFVAAQGPGWGHNRGKFVAATVAILVALTVTIMATASNSASTVGNDEVRTRQWVPGPEWAGEPRAVPPTFFGVSMNSTSGVMPSFRVGSVRFWDSNTRWANLQPRRGEFDWTTLDRLVAGAERAGLPELFVLGGTPGWAAPNGPKAPYDDGSRTAPPDEMADWDAFVRALVQRYRGRLDAYELWVLANDRHFYSGSISKLVEMTRRASGIIQAVDPNATVVCPSMGRLWHQDAQRVLRRFAELGGYQHCDVAGIKLYQRTPSDPPETMLEVVRTTYRTLHRAGTHPRLWNTGTTYEIPLQRRLDDEQARNHAVRFFLTGLYASEFGLERMYFYNWGSTELPIVLQAEGGAPTRAALAVERLQRWLHDASLRSCGHGPAIGMPQHVWQCEFRVAGGDHRRRAVIRWTHDGTVETPAGPGAESVRRLDATQQTLDATDTVRVTEAPVMISYR